MFDADAILYGDTPCTKMDILMFLAVFSVRFWLESGKICKNRSTFFIFTFIFADFPCFFLQGEISSWGGRDRKISASVSALYMSFGWQGWTTLFDLVYTAEPNISI